MANWPGRMKLNKLDAAQTRLMETPEGMRKLIEQYVGSDAMTGAYYHATLHRQMSTLDFVTVLAFEALRDRERLTDLTLENIMLKPAAPILIRQPE